MNDITFIFSKLPLFYSAVFFPFIIFLFVIFITSLLTASIFPNFKCKSMIYTKILVLLSFIKIYFTSYTFFSWPQVVDQILALKILNPDILINDFLLTYDIHSVRYFFSKFLSLFSYIGISTEYISNYLVLLGKLTMIPLLFLLIVNLLKLYLPLKKHANSYESIKFFLFLLLTGELFFKYLLFFPTIGWSQFYGYSVGYVSGFSIYLAMLFLLFSIFSMKRMSIICLFFSSLFQISHGAIFLVLYLLFVYPKKGTYKHVLSYIFTLSFVVLIYLIFYHVKSPITAQEFIDIFVKLRHPHHMLISSIFTKFQFIWVFMLSLPIFMLSKFNQKRLQYSIFIYVIIWVISIITQYLITEIFPVKTLASLTINRFTETSAFVLIFSYSICFYHIFCSRFKLTPFNFPKFNYTFNLPKQFLIGLNSLLVVLVLISFFWNKQITTNNIYALQNLYGKNLISNIKTLTLSNNEIYCMNYQDNSLLTYYIRFFANRSIYFDMSIPMHEDGFLEFKRRHDKLLKISSYTPKQIFNEYNEEFRYLIIEKKLLKKFKNYQPLFVSESYYCYDIFTFK